MTTIFQTVCSMSITGSWVILAVILARLLLKKAPKRLSYALWAVAGFRLCCPVSFEAVFSLFRIPNIQTGATLTQAPAAEYTVLTAPQQAPAVQPVSPAPQPATFDWMQLFAILWLAGMAALLVYSIVCDLRLRLRLRTAIRDRDNIYRSEHIRSPFILGFIRPRIYLPYGLEPEQEDSVLQHERCHLKRGDHIIKLLSFLILTLHWFNPLCHAAFYLLNRDMEMSCDERVLEQNTDRKHYCTTLVSIAADRPAPLPGPLAFGETSVKLRVKNILRWKKAKVWTVVLAVILCVIVILACAADPISRPVLEDGTYMGLTTEGEDFNFNYTSFYRVKRNAFSITFGGANYDVDLSGKEWEAPPYTQAQWDSILLSCTGSAPKTIASCRYMPVFTSTMDTVTNISPGSTDETVPTTFTRTVFLLKEGSDIFLCGYSENQLADSGESTALSDYFGTTAERLVLVGSSGDPFVTIFPQLDALAETILDAPGTLEEKIAAENDAYWELLRSRDTVFYICDALHTDDLKAEKAELIARLYADTLERRGEDPMVARGDLAPMEWIEASLQANREYYHDTPFSSRIAALQMLTFLDNYY